MNNTIAAHGGDLYDTAHYSFIFRGKTYQFKNDGYNYEYTKTFQKQDSLIIDRLKNGTFTRTVNGDAISLSPKAIASGFGAINSVIYFATLPHKLKDKAVIKSDLGNTSVNGENYAVLGVTFQQEGGGEDHDDAYVYWINTTSNKIDYLAYNYHVNKGGVRFRSAYNSRVIDGITFQNYVNYEAEVGTPLTDLPALYEAGKLKELSKIETENVMHIVD
ncbi:DUF6503 family protein [Formosa haliotis]|uniref:DUF6503 family protein n=1 Tax=Formosa haliotis TaxID=1555194 RepID=UPI000AE0AAD3|nr:DUF6503 family protein [Formosa haliotis]